MPNLQKIADDPEALKASVDRMMQMRRPAPPRDMQCAEPVVPPLVFTYTNWRGETATRRVIPFGFQHGSTSWHPESQWLMEAQDLEKGERRLFAWKDMVPADFAARLDRAEFDRDAAEDALSDAFKLVCGRRPVWSERFGYAAALDEMAAMLEYLHNVEAAVNKEPEDDAPDPRRREGQNAACAVFYLFCIAGIALRGDMLGTGIVLLPALWHLIQAARWASKANAREMAHA